jgi:hypothetical protein
MTDISMDGTSETLGGPVPIDLQIPALRRGHESALHLFLWNWLHRR